MAFFDAAADPGELIALAWLLEDGSARFYAAVDGMQSAPEAAGLFSTLVKDEEHHKDTLQALYSSGIGREAGPDFPKGLAAALDGKDRMEGSMKVSEALAWARNKGIRELLELSMALETDSYDLYIKLGRTASGEHARKVFMQLVAVEKDHLARMADLLDHIPL